MPAGSVAAYQAALETTNTAMSYGMEASWATAPASTFQAMRVLSETLAHKKTRVRPPEVRGDRQAAPAITSQESASGNIVFPVFFAEAGKASQFDDFMSALVGGDWQFPTTFSGAGGDIALAANGTITSTTAGKFVGITPGQVIKLRGFTNAVNNGFYRTLPGVSATTIPTVPMGFTPIAETPAGAAANIYLSNLRNGPYFKSLYVQQRLDPLGTKWFRYPGLYPTKASLTLSIGQFLQATFDAVAQQELKGTLDASTGGIIAAPSTKDLDPVGGFKGVFWNDAQVAAGINSCGFEISNEGANGEFFLGSPLAQGMIGGTLMADAKLDMAFKDFTYYDQFRAETTGTFAVRFGDQAGNSYVITLLNAVLLFDSGVNNTGPNKMMTAQVTVEGSPDPNGQGTISIDRFPAGV